MEKEEILIESQDLKKGLEIVGSAKASGESLVELYPDGTLYYLGAEGRVITKLEFGGSLESDVCLSLDKLKAVAKIAEGTLTLSLTPNKVQAKFNKSKISLSRYKDILTFNSRLISEGFSDQSIRVTIDDWIVASNLAMLTTSKFDGAKWLYSAVLLRINAGLEMLSCNGNQFSKIEIKSSKNSFKEFSELIPASTFSSIASFLKAVKAKKGDEVVIYKVENTLVFQYEEHRFFAKLSSGQFPDISRVLEIDLPIKTELECSVLSETLQRAAPFFSDRGICSFDFKPGVLTVDTSGLPGETDSPYTEEIELSNEVTCDFTTFGKFLILVLPKLSGITTLHTSELASNPILFRGEDGQLAYTIALARFS